MADEDEDEDEDEKRTTPHDRLVKRILTQPEAAGVELRHVLPPRIARTLDFEGLHVERSTFIGSPLDKGRSDILYSLPIKGTEQRVLIYVLLEHQSQPDPLMPWRVLKYLVWIWDQYIADQPGSVRTLPFIVPVVLAQCENGWTAPYRLSELFELPDELREVLGARWRWSCEWTRSMDRSTENSSYGPESSSWCS